MRFHEKLKRAMQDLGINQAQVVGMTGIGKSSISQYLSGKIVPPQNKQRDIAVSLGLEPDYFEQDTEPILKLARRSDAVIPELRTKEVGKLMGMGHTTVEAGLKQGVFPWGYAIKTSENTYRYFINARRFAAIEMVEVPSEMVVQHGT